MQEIRKMFLLEKCKVPLRHVFACRSVKFFRNRNICCDFLTSDIEVYQSEHFKVNTMRCKKFAKCFYSKNVTQLFDTFSPVEVLSFFRNRNICCEFLTSDIVFIKVFSRFSSINVIINLVMFAPLVVK